MNDLKYTFGNMFLKSRVNVYLVFLLILSVNTLHRVKNYVFLDTYYNGFQMF